MCNFFPNPDLRYLLTVWVSMALLAGCRSFEPPPEVPAEPEQLGQTYPASLTPSGVSGDLYEVDALASRAVIIVRRAGPLARFGHDHVILADKIEGRIAWHSERPGDSLAQLRVDVRSLKVDPLEVRTEFNLDTQPDDDAVSGTRTNLFEHVLDSERWPEVVIRVDAAEESGSPSERIAEIMINGQSRRSPVPIAMDLRNQSLETRGQFSILQTDWGIEPFSILGGGLRVEDELTIHFRLIARKYAD